MLVPIGSPHQDNAEKLIDYYYDPQVAAKVAEYVNYVCPVEGAKAGWRRSTRGLADSPWIFPPRPTCASQDLPHPHRRRGHPVLGGLPEGDRQLMAGAAAGPAAGAVTKTFGSFMAVDDVSLTVPQGSFFALLGPSGCGKTTTLRMVAGLERPTGGRGAARRRGRDRASRTSGRSTRSSRATRCSRTWTCSRTSRSGCAGAGPGGRGGSSEALELVELGAPGPAQAGPASGGQQQRVALARAVVNRPDVLLLDEPLGALDLKLRRQMQLELKRIQTEVGITFVHVTHDQEEAMTMADTIAVMNAGRIEQLGSPVDLYESPAPRTWPTSSASRTCCRATVTGASTGRSCDRRPGP